jgi:peptide methionine sulfoxide reductase MsrA
LAYQLPASSTFLSEQTNHQQPANITFHSKQISIGHQPAVLFSQNKPTTNNQPTLLFTLNKSASAISHQPNEQADTWPTSYKDFNSNSNKNLEHFAKYRAPDEFGSSN